MAGMFASPFAIRQPGDTLAQGGWPSVLPPNPVPGAFPPAPNPAPTSSPSFFGDGGTGRNIAGAIGDFLLQQAHAQPIFAPVQQQRVMMARQMAEAERKRQAELYAPRDVGGNLIRLNPTTNAYDTLYTPPAKPVSNDTVNDYGFIADKLGPEAAANYLRNIAAGPPMAIDNGDGTKTIYPRGAFGGAGAGGMPSGPAPGTIKGGFRFKGGNPNDQSSWEAVGGPTPSASGTFR